MEDEEYLESKSKPKPKSKPKEKEKKRHYKTRSSSSSSSKKRKSKKDSSSSSKKTKKHSEESKSNNNSENKSLDELKTEITSLNDTQIISISNIKIESNNENNNDENLNSKTEITSLNDTQNKSISSMKIDSNNDNDNNNIDENLNSKTEIASLNDISSIKIDSNNVVIDSKDENKIINLSLVNIQETTSNISFDNFPYENDIQKSTEFINQKKMLNDEIMHFIINDIFGIKELNDDILYISSLNIENVLRKHFQKKYQCIGDIRKRNEKVKTDLGITGSTIKDYKVIMIVIHGPRTLNDNPYNFELDNCHWSLLTWFKFNNKSFHYDSMSTLNSNICKKTITILQQYNVLPETIFDFFIPKFIQQQQGGWECGYFVLMFIKIIIDNIKNSTEMPQPIGISQIKGKYQKWIKNITLNGVGTFLYFLCNSLNNMKNANIYANI